MNVLEVMREILADADTERRNRRIRAWYAADRGEGRGGPHPIIGNALRIAPEDLASRWYAATNDAMSGPPAEDPESAGSPGHRLLAGAKPGGARRSIG